MLKTIKTKPMLYVVYFQRLQQIAAENGYELLLHGSLNRDCDLVAVPWDKKRSTRLELVDLFCEHLTGRRWGSPGAYQWRAFPGNPRREAFIIDLKADTGFYLDISVY